MTFTIGKIIQLSSHFCPGRAWPELANEPPDPQPNPQITRPDYEYQPPQERADVVDEALTSLSEIESSLRFLNRADPDAEDNFPGAQEALNLIAAMLQAHRVLKVGPWLED